jgi:hypothetical protein
MVAAMPPGVGAGPGVDRLVCAGGAAWFAPRPGSLAASGAATAAGLAVIGRLAAVAP